MTAKINGEGGAEAFGNYEAYAKLSKEKAEFFKKIAAEIKAAPVDQLIKLEAVMRTNLEVLSDKLLALQRASDEDPTSVEIKLELLDNREHTAQLLERLTLVQETLSKKTKESN